MRTEAEAQKDIDRCEREIQKARDKIKDTEKRKFALYDERTEARRHKQKTCSHNHTHTEVMGFSDDSYSHWTENVKACSDCGQSWR